jgi:D-threo-aldose 1-dehydrogenase
VGTASIGGLLGAVSTEAAAGALDHALDSGLNLFDTAPGYGYGLAERRLGQSLSSRRRDEYVLSTKVGRLLRERTPDDAEETLFIGAPPLIDYFDFSYDGVMRSVEGSLERLGLDRIDVLHIHDPDDRYDQALAGAYGALSRLREEGSVRAIGVGANRSDELIRFAVDGRFDCFLLAGRYTVLDQSALPDLLPLCVERQIGVIIGGVFNSGIMAKVHANATFDYRKADPPILERARAIAAICDRYNVSTRAVALQFPFGHPAVRAVIPGVRSSTEVASNIAAFRAEIPGTLWSEFKDAGLLSDEVPTPQAG